MSSNTGCGPYVFARVLTRVLKAIKAKLAAPIIHNGDVPSLVEFDCHYEKWMAAKADEIFQLPKEKWPVAVADATPHCNEYMEPELRVLVMLRSALNHKFGTTGR